MTDHRLRHGEAVSIGMALDATYSHQAGLLSEPDWRRVLNVLVECALPIYASELEKGLDTPKQFDSILHGLEEFREHLGGQLTIMLLKGIGNGVEVHAMDLDRVRSSVAALRQFTPTGIEILLRG
jgi:3-dehydroquinate synthase